LHERILIAFVDDRKWNERPAAEMDVCWAAVEHLIKASTDRMDFVPAGQHDRSQARVCV
jgi:hypothetical protein